MHVSVELSDRVLVGIGGLLAGAGGSIVQSILVPPFLYQAGDRLRIAQGNRSRGVELVRCLQLNGLFSHYELGRG